MPSTWFDHGRREVKVGDERRKLTNAEWRLLVILWERRDRLVPVAILGHLLFWGSDSEAQIEAVIKVHICRMRSALADTPLSIVNQHGVGYMLTIGDGGDKEIARKGRITEDSAERWRRMRKWNHKVKCAAVLVLVTSGAEAAQTAANVTIAVTHPAMRAYDFYQKFGVNGNLDSGGSVANELTDMAYVGVSNIRSSAYNSTTGDAANWMQALAQLAAKGLRQHIDVQASAGLPFTSMADWVSALKTYIVQPYSARMVTGVSGPNETDTGQDFSYNGMSGITAANAAQADLYAAMKADPDLSSIPVDMWPLGFYNTASTSVGDQTAHCDRANMHDYYAVDGLSALQGAGAPGDIEQRLTGFFVPYYRQACNRPRIITTETGFGSTTCAGCAQSASEYVQARLALIDLLTHAAQPNVEQTYYFTLRWGSPQGSGNWGLINDDGSHKPAADALHNLTAILNDPGDTAATFSPAPFNYSVTGPPAGGNFVVQKSSGAFEIMVWNEAPIWNIATATPVTILPSQMTVSLPAGSHGNIYDPINNATTPISTFADVNSINLALGDAPLIVEILP